MATEKQTIANRRNAQRSTGPATPEGKAAVAQNPVKHGLFAQKNLIAGEDPAEYDRHRRALLAALRPADPLELLLAERVVALAWRLLRTNRMQAEAIDVLNPIIFSHEWWKQITPRQPDLSTPQPPLMLGCLTVNDLRHSQVLDRLLTYENRLEQTFHRACRQLHDRQAARIRAQCQPRLTNEPAVTKTAPSEKAKPILTTP